MPRRFASRAEFLYEHFIAGQDDRSAPASRDPAQIESLRKGLLIIGQESRFDLFLLILHSPGQFTLEDLAAKVHLSREKVQYHLYYMLTNGIVLAGGSDGRTLFRPNPVFLKYVSRLFTAP